MPLPLLDLGLPPESADLSSDGEEEGPNLGYLVPVYSTSIS